MYPGSWFAFLVIISIPYTHNDSVCSHPGIIGGYINHFQMKRSLYIQTVLAVLSPTIIIAVVVFFSKHRVKGVHKNKHLSTLPTLSRCYPGTIFPGNNYCGPAGVSKEAISFQGLVLQFASGF